MLKSLNQLAQPVIVVLACLLPLSAFSAGVKGEQTHNKPILMQELPKPVYPIDQTLYDQYPWSVMYYAGTTFNTSLFGLFVGNYRTWSETIQSLELAHTLNQDNFLRRLVSRICGVVELAGNVTYRHGENEHRIYEFDPYLIFRWANMPWNHYVVTSVAIGEGVSYVSSIPSVERRYTEDTKRLMNYLMLEATFAPPAHPQFQFLIRIHHRSGAFGLYGAGNTASNDLGLGIRYLFD